jgi:hypothetical protein
MLDAVLDFGWQKRVRTRIAQRGLYSQITKYAKVGENKVDDPQALPAYDLPGL